MNATTCRTLFCLLLLSVSARGATLSGTVRNGTSNSPVAGQTVVLMKLAGGMDEIASARTDAQGRFQFDQADLGAQPFLVRVNYKGVFFHANVPPGKNSADVEVFEPTATAADLQLTSRALVVQPNGATLLVGEEYEITNISRPPAAFSKEFEFALPEGAEIAQVSAWGPSGMPTVQGTINKGSNRFAIAFPLRPGKNGVRVSYSLPYSTQQATIGAASAYATASVMVIAPPQMQIAAEGLQSAGQREGWKVFAREKVPPGAALQIRVSGTAPPPADPAGGSEGQAGSGSAASGSEVRAMPARLDDLKWVLTAGFAALFFLGAVYLWRRQPPGALAGAGARGASAGAAPAAAPSALPAQVEQHVQQSLDELKDAVFRLELRRQAGTISEEDYARERARTEQILRELVRG
jgi:hypothetical protein